MAKPVQLVIDGITWCGWYHITENNMVKFEGFPHPDYTEENLNSLFEKIGVRKFGGK